MKELQLTFKFETEPLKRLFYLFMSWYGTFWFLSVPTSTLIAHFLPDWKREKIVTGIYLVITALTFSILAWMFRPSKGNKYFSILDPNLQVTFGTNQLQIFPEHPSSNVSPS